jgi:hypothetical protein
MKTHAIGLLCASMLVSAVLFAPATAFAEQKTAKDCVAEWKANKDAMKAAGKTQKDYVAECTGKAEPTPTSSGPLASSPSAAGPKTAKDCVAEWKANKDAMKAAGKTQKDYVAECSGKGETTAAAEPSAPTKASAVTGAKTDKECTAEWRANKDAMKAAGKTEKAYVAECVGGAAAAAPEMPAAAPTMAAPKTVAAPPAPTPMPTPAPAPISAPAPAKPSVTPSTEASKKPMTVGKPEAANEFATEAQAKAHCPSDTVVWANLDSKIFHYSGTDDYGTTKKGAYMCEKDTAAAGIRAAKNEKAQ